MVNLILTYKSYHASLVAYHRVMRLLEAYKLDHMMQIVPDINGQEEFVLAVVAESPSLLEDMYPKIITTAYVAE